MSGVYNDNMGTKSTETFVEEDGEKKDALQLTFTNGSLQQLKDLAAFLKVAEPAQVIEKAIGIIQQVKDMDDKDRNVSFDLRSKQFLVCPTT